MPLAAVVGSVIGGVISSHGASRAANTQAQAANTARDVITGNANQALGLQRTALGQEQANFAPYQQAGTGALTKLENMQPFSAPTGVTEQNDPGYQFRLAQGQKALENSAAARGSLLTGGTAKALNDYAQGSASSEYGNVYNRALQSYQTNANNQFQLANMGENAATNLSGAEANNANAQSSILGNSANEQAQQINNAAAARASGYAGQANAITGAIPGVAQGLTDIYRNGYFGNYAG